MKLWKFALSLVVWLGFCEGARYCKVSLLRSLGYSSLFKSNVLNPICPSAIHNCCSKIDILAIHKSMSTLYSGGMSSRYGKVLADFRMIGAVVKGKDSFDFDALASAWISKFGASAARAERLKSLVDALSKNRSSYFARAFEQLEAGGLLVGMFGEMTRLRKGFLCALCSQESHAYFSPESRAVSLGNKFCLGLVSRFSGVLRVKYVQLFPLLLQIDELFLLATGAGFFTEAERRLYKNLVFWVQACADKPNDLDICAPLCAQFKLNEFGAVYDGEEDLGARVSDFVMERLTKIQTKNPKAVQAMLKFEPKIWTAAHLRLSAAELESIGKKLRAPLSRGNFFQLNFKQRGQRGYLEIPDRVSPLQIDLLDLDDTKTLFRLADPPVDFNSLAFRFEENGLNLFEHSENLNFDIQPEILMSLLFNDKLSTRDIDEEIEPEVASIMKVITIIDLNDFHIDASMSFADPLDLDDSKPRKLNRGFAILWGAVFAMAALGF